MTEKRDSQAAEQGDPPEHLPSQPPPRRAAKRLLVASIGVATLNYAGACKDAFVESVSNLMAAPTTSVAPTGQGTFGATAQGAPLPPLNPVPPATGVVPQPNGIAGNAAPADADAGADSDAGPSGRR